jgi:hypothetical protein
MTQYVNVDGKTLPWVASAAHLLGQMFGLSSILGWRESDPYPDHPSGRALDLMTTNGQPVADYLVANASALGIDYLIWNDRTWNSTRRTWVPYQPTNPNRHRHRDHVHATFKTTGPAGGLTLTGLGSSIAGAAGAAVGSAFNLDKTMRLVEGTTLNFVAAAFGAALLGVGIVLAVKPRRKET